MRSGYLLIGALVALLGMGCHRPAEHANVPTDLARAATMPATQPKEFRDKVDAESSRFERFRRRHGSAAGWSSRYDRDDESPTRAVLAITWFVDRWTALEYAVLADGRKWDREHTEYDGGAGDLRATHETRLSADELRAIEEAARNVPLRITDAPTEQLVIVSHWVNDQWTTETYDSALLPPQVEKLIRLVGERDAPTITNRGEGFHLTARLQNGNTTRLGEPIFVVLRLENISPEPLWLWQRVRIKQADYEMTREDGGSLPYTRAGEQLNDTRRMLDFGIREVRPGEAIEQVDRVDDLYQIDKPGRYRLRVEYRVPSRKIAGNGRFMDLGVRLEAKPFSFTVVE